MLIGNFLIRTTNNKEKITLEDPNKNIVYRAQFELKNPTLIAEGLLEYSHKYNAKVYINRAATRFPYGLKGIIYDCNKAIAIDSTDKNAYFLRGLANYGLDEKEAKNNGWKLYLFLCKSNKYSNVSSFILFL